MTNTCVLVFGAKVAGAALPRRKGIRYRGGILSRGRRPSTYPVPAGPPANFNAYYPRSTPSFRHPTNICTSPQAVILHKWPDRRLRLRDPRRCSASSCEIATGSRTAMRGRVLSEWLSANACSSPEAGDIGEHVVDHRGPILDAEVRVSNPYQFVVPGVVGLVERRCVGLCDQSAAPFRRRPDRPQSRLR